MRLSNAAGTPSQPSAAAGPSEPTPVTSAPPVSPLPERISRLADLTQNLWWSWQLDARELFHRLDHRLWEATRHNAVEFLRQVDPERLEPPAGATALLTRQAAVVRRIARH